MQSNIESNQRLIERFPFLMPRNRWTGKVPDDYDYSYTELDSMPDGWRKAFGEQMCEDIREELVHAEYLDQYRISQIKEKYGTLCWYDFGCTERMLRDIIPKYEHLSARTCIRCGNPATKVLEMSRNVQSGNTQNLKSSAASDQAAVCACAHSWYFTGGSPSGLRV